MFYTAMFMNLRKLVISPQQITHDVLMHLLHGTAIQDLVIVQNQNTGPSEAISHMSWFDIKQIKPGNSVYFYLQCYAIIFIIMFGFVIILTNSQFDGPFVVSDIMSFPTLIHAKV